MALPPRGVGQEGYPHRLRSPRWNGEPFVGRTLLVHHEQGFGDTLQFVRYLPMAKARGGRVLFEVPAVLRPLVRGVPARMTSWSFRRPARPVSRTTCTSRC